MKKNIVFLEIEKILDKWDPTGILQGVSPIQYSEGNKGEYSKYIPVIINLYVSNRSIYDYLIKLQADLWVYPSEEMKEEISIISKKFISLLSQCNIRELE